jgi:hypothetical protein
MVLSIASTYSIQPKIAPPLFRPHLRRFHLYFALFLLSQVLVRMQIIQKRL